MCVGSWKKGRKLRNHSLPQTRILLVYFREYNGLQLLLKVL